MGCASDCSPDFDEGTEVTLTATEDAGSTFSVYSKCAKNKTGKNSVNFEQ
jgi:hypothetical protein